MNSTTRNWIIGVIIAAALVGGAVYLGKKTAGNSTATTASTTVTTLPDGSTVSSNGGVTVNEIPVTNGPAAPNYMKPIAFDAATAADTAVKTQLNSALAATQAEIKADPKNFDAWVSLGTIYNEGGDRQDAITIWKYADATWPSNITTPFNLGNVYMTYLHQYPQAETEFKTAIARSPSNPSAYRALFELYTETSYHPSATAAENILKAGIKAAPGAYDLDVLLARYYKQQGRTAEANAAYDAAIASAKAANQQSVADQILQEKNGQ